MARQASPLTLAARKLLVQSRGKIKATEALPKLLKLGFENVESHAFNQIKANWKARRDAEGTGDSPTAKRGKKTKIDVTQEEAIAFVRENGGMKAAKKSIQRQIALLREAENALLALA